MSILSSTEKLLDQGIRDMDIAAKLRRTVPQADRLKQKGARMREAVGDNRGIRDGNGLKFSHLGPKTAAPAAEAAVGGSASIKGVLGGWKSNLMDAHSDWLGVAGAAGKTAIRGAVIGGAVGGTTEWAQGGSFWAGAKSGAWSGAQIGAGLRVAQSATGAAKMNPLSKQGPLYAGYKQAGPAISEQVKAISKTKSHANVASNVMNGGARI